MVTRQYSHKVILYSLIIIIISQLTTHTFNIASGNEPQQQRQIGSKELLKIFEKYVIIMSKSNIKFRISALSDITLNRNNKKLALNIIKKLPMKNGIECYEGDNSNFIIRTMPDFVIDIDRVTSGKNDNIMQILYYKDCCVRNNKQKKAESYMTLSAGDIDSKKLITFVLLVWGKEADDFVSDIEQICKKQQSKFSKKDKIIFEESSRIQG